MRDPEHLDWARAQRATVPLLASVCTETPRVPGARPLTGRPAATHWESHLLSELDPTVETDVDARFIDDGDLITTDGVSAGIELALHPVNRFGQNRPTVPVRSRRGIQYDPQPPG